MKVYGTHVQTDEGPVLESVVVDDGIYNKLVITPGQIRDLILDLERFLPGNGAAMPVAKPEAKRSWWKVWK